MMDGLGGARPVLEANAGVPFEFFCLVRQLPRRHGPAAQAQICGVHLDIGGARQHETLLRRAREGRKKRMEVKGRRRREPGLPRNSSNMGRDHRQVDRRVVGYKSEPSVDARGQEKGGDTSMSLPLPACGRVAQSDMDPAISNKRAGIGATGGGVVGWSECAQTTQRPARLGGQDCDKPGLRHLRANNRFTELVTRLLTRWPAPSASVPTTGEMGRRAGECGDALHRRCCRSLFYPS